jgi:hypothetical protein
MTDGAAMARRRQKIQEPPYAVGRGPVTRHYGGEEIGPDEALPAFGVRSRCGGPSTTSRPPPRRHPHLAPEHLRQEVAKTDLPAATFGTT